MRVPLGRGERLAVGYCVRVDAAAPDDLDPARIKDVVEVLDPLPLIDDKMLDLTRWMADYYACSWGQALDAVVPAGVKKHAGTRVGTFLVVPEEIRADLQAEILKRRLPPKQVGVLEVLCRSDEPLTVADVCRMAKCTTVPIQGLAKTRAGQLRSDGGCQSDCRPIEKLARHRRTNSPHERRRGPTKPMLARHARHSPPSRRPRSSSSCRRSNRADSRRFWFMA